MKTSRRKGRSLNMEGELSPEEDRSYVKPAWWEIAVFRFLNAIMVIFFLTAVVKLQSDDNSCLWTPTFLVPAILSTIVAVKPQLSGDQVWPVVKMLSKYHDRVHLVEGPGGHPHLHLHTAGRHLVHPAPQDDPRRGGDPEHAGWPGRRVLLLSGQPVPVRGGKVGAETRPQCL